MAQKSKKSNKNKETANTKDLKMIDRAVQNIFQILDPTYAGKEAISTKDNKIRGILNRELEISDGVSGGAIVDFIASLKKEGNPTQNDRRDKNDIFKENVNDIFTYFEKVYQNKFLELKDLQFIARFIPSLGECVRTQLDSIVSSDTISDTINFSFELPASTTNEDRSAILDEIKRSEKEIFLRSKLKNIVYKKALISGTEYVYAKPYSEIFKEFDCIKKNNEKNIANGEISQFSTTQKATESFMLGDIDIQPAMESILEDASTTNKNAIKNEWPQVLSHFNISHSGILSEALESASSLYDNTTALEAFKKEKERDKEKDETLTSKDVFSSVPEAVTDGSDPKKLEGSDFDIPGLYIKYINAHELIPIRVFDTTIAYARVHTNSRKMTKGGSMNTTTMGIGQGLFSNLDFDANKREKTIQNLTDTISSGIIDVFDKKFVMKNAEFKELISNCVIANGLTDKEYNIQIIPAEDIIPFRIQEGEDGYGRSMLADSLFPGKLLLSLIVSRMLNYINKTGNRTIAHIHKGPIGTMENNMIDRVIQDMQDGEVTFSDLLSPNLVFNKFNRNGNLQMPIAQNGNHLVELETQEGQTIDMDPEYEKKLEQMAIVGSGVPTGALDYESQADFAKEVVSSHLKYAGRTGCYQGDLEPPTTMLYKKLLSSSNLTDSQKSIVKHGLKVTLPRPRARTNENSAEFLRTLVELADDIAKMLIGQEKVQNIQEDKNLAVAKDSLQREIVIDLSPFVDWEKYKVILERSEIDVTDESKQEGNGPF